MSRSSTAPDPASVTAVLASANPHKAAEIAAIVADVVGPRLHLLPRPADVGPVEESGTTFEENALLKAHALRDATGLAALADDSGLAVDALGGAPGVRSARYAGEDATDAANVAKLLGALAEVGALRPEQRRARFTAVVALAWPDGRDTVVTGTVDGTIADRPRGEAGFGYDPVFVPDGADGRTFAELPADAKAALSHRGRALRALAAALTDGPQAPRAPATVRRVLMVCLGNICRSPMAAAVATALLDDVGLAGAVEVESYGTSGYHRGERADPGAEAALRRRGLTAAGHRARQLTVADLTRADLVLCADRANLAAVRRLLGDRVGPEVRLLRSFDPSAGPDAEVPDPYGGDDAEFDRTLDSIEAACRGLVDELVRSAG